MSDAGAPPAATPRAGSAARGARGAASAGHPLAVSAALGILRSGGNAVDAAVAAQAVCCVVMPQACGVGGDALLLVRDARGVLAVTGSGRTAAAAPPGAYADGGASVCVPGAVQAWADVLERQGSRSLEACLAPAVEIAVAGFEVGVALGAAVEQQRARLLRGGAGPWGLLSARPGDVLRQPELAQVLQAVGRTGRDALYDGELAVAVAAAARRDGGWLQASDLRSHESLVGDAVQVPWAGGTVSVQPAPSQGVLLACALRWLEQQAAAGEAVGFDTFDHVAVELTEAVFGYRDRCAAEGALLLDLPLEVDRDRAARRGGPRSYLHTTGVAVADAQGTVVSSLVSVFDDFGSATFVPDGGFVLNNRAAGFGQEPNAAGPSRRPVHTLAPLLLEHGGNVLALATPGADGQVQTLLQVLHRLRGGAELTSAVGAARWRSENGRLLVGRGHRGTAMLTARGHDVQVVADGDDRFGAVVAAGTGPQGPYAVGDWRREVACGGVS